MKQIIPKKFTRQNNLLFSYQVMSNGDTKPFRLTRNLRPQVRISMQIIKKNIDENNQKFFDADTIMVSKSD